MKETYITYRPVKGTTIFEGPYVFYKSTRIHLDNRAPDYIVEEIVGEEEFNKLKVDIRTIKFPYTVVIK